MLPSNPLQWPEPYRSIYLERREERIAIMVNEGGQSEHAAAVAAEVARIEHEMRLAYAEGKR